MSETAEGAHKPMAVVEAEEITTVERPRWKKRFTQGAKELAQLAGDALAVAAPITESLPYLGAVSTALTKIIAVFNELETLKSEWGAAKDDIQSIRRIVHQIRDKRQAEIGQGQTALPDTLKGLFSDLETVLKDAMERLATCEFPSKRFSWRTIKNVAKRGELTAEVARCRQDIKGAREDFLFGLHVNHFLSTESLRAERTENSANSRGDTSEHLPPSQTSSDWPASYLLPPAPAIFHGREQEVSQVVDLVTKNSPARVAILGPAGIGKTSIALSVLHHPSIQEVYSQNRFFVICETYTSADGLALGILDALGLAPGLRARMSPDEYLLSSLRPMHSLLCLDHLEAPWDADTDRVEAFLTRIVDIPKLTLLVTARGANRPGGISWTKPFLPPIKALDLTEAVKIWKDISHVQDQSAALLCIHVHCVPLAVTILAQLAESESAKSLLERWESEKTDIMRRSHGSENRLNSLPYSIDLSLSSPRLASEIGARTCLSLLCALPSGLPVARIAALEKAFEEPIPHLRRCISLLQRCSLISTSERWIRILPTIREHVTLRHPVAEPLLANLADIYCAMVREDLPENAQARKRFLDEIVNPESGNIANVLKMCMKRDAPPADLGRFLWAVMDYVWLFGELSSLENEYELLELAEDFARKRQSTLRVQVLRQMAQVHLLADIAKAQELFLEALELDIASNDLLGQAEDWHGLGIASVRQGHAGAAETALEMARGLHAKVEDSYGEAHDWQALAVVHALQGNSEAAQDAAHEALRLHEEVEDCIGPVNALDTGGVLLYHVGDLSEAEEVLLAARKLHERAGARLGQANDLYALSNICVKLDRLGMAENAVTEALDLHAAVEDRLGEAADLRLLGELRRQSRRFASSKRYLRRALALSREVGDVLGQIASRHALGDLYEQLGQGDKAKTEYKRARKCGADQQVGQIRVHDGLSLELKLLGKLYGRIGRIDPAREGEAVLTCVEPYDQWF